MKLSFAARLKDRVSIALLAASTGLFLVGSCADHGSSLVVGSDAGTHDVVFLFGGDSNFSDGVLGDTWQWDGALWSKLGTTGPQARIDGSSSMPICNGAAVLFGGEIPGMDQAYPSTTLGDTWTLSGGVWTKQNVAGPSARDGTAMASFDNGVVLFGGGIAHGSGNGGIIEVFGDTWNWDGSAWTQMATTGPSPRYGSVMARLNGVVVLFGGEFNEHQVGGSLQIYADTWTWDGTAWTQHDVPGPSARAFASMVPLDGKLVLFGGMGETGAYADTWTWDGSAWTQLDVVGPPARLNAPMAPLDGKLVLFGGSDNNNKVVFSDTWTWDGSTWTQQNVSGPSPRLGAAMTVP